MVGLVLAISAALCWGAGDFLGGLTARRLPVALVVAASQVVGVGILLVVVVAQSARVERLSDLLPAIGAGGAAALGLMALYKALALGPMSIVAPLAATSAAVPVFVGAIEGEQPSFWQVAGMILAGLGTILVTLREKNSQRGEVRSGIPLAIFAAVCLGAGLWGIHVGAEKTQMWAVLAARVTSLGVLGVLFLVSGQVPHGIRGNIRRLTVLGLLDVGGVSFFALASLHGLLVVVSVAANLYPVITVALARLVLRERVQGIQRLGMASALLGIGLLGIA